MNPNLQMKKRSDSRSRQAAPGKSRKASRPYVKQSRSRSNPAPAGGKPFAPGEEVRLNRYIARSGVCSRREADEMIASGLVKVDDAVVTELGTKIRIGARVEVNGKRIAPAHLIYLLLNKPTDTITTTSDEKGRTSVLDLIHDEDLDRSSLFPVGRLDRHTTGALLITNDGDLAHRLMHPSYEVDKTYVVETKDPITDVQVRRLAEGVTLDDGPAKADRISRPPSRAQNFLALSIHEGRNRQVRRMFEALGHDVVSLERVRYAGLTTRGIRKGKWRRLDRKEVKSLYRKVKL